jgi:hypothetical protein
MKMFVKKRPWRLIVQLRPRYERRIKEWAIRHDTSYAGAVRFMIAHHIYCKHKEDHEI